MKNIIVLEDNKDINTLLTDILTDAGYQVFSSTNAFDALKDFKNHKIDCILTDLMIPIMSGEEFIQEIRKTSDVHIIIISAKTTIPDKLEGLKIGADDYLFKPFLEEELLLKLRNLFQKRDKKESKQSFNNHQVIFEEGKPQLLINDKIVSLTGIEYNMVSLLVNKMNRVVSRDQILDALYAYGEEVFDRVVDVHIRNIRKKINTVYDKTLIKTVYGLGYTWVGELDE
ncbi:MAG: response regulator transcription factor [Candidatus Izemoplasma sp.]|nr:response regulator transcription factor [Candidatus Izemoplasma sp.]